MRHTKAEAERTRERLLGAALAAFAEGGVRATTLEDVAALAGVTRGAVYWHFADKAALVAEVVKGLRWPLDIGADIEAYRVHPQPLELLRAQLWGQMQRCMQDPSQWRMVQLMLRHSMPSELSDEVMARVEHAMDDTVQRLGQVMAMAQHRGHLRAGLPPMEVALGLHAVGIGLLSEHANEMAHSHHGHDRGGCGKEGNGAAQASFLSLDLFMAGACVPPSPSPIQADMA